MDAVVLEQNHWKSPAPSPSRIALPLQSSPSRSHRDGSTLHEATTGGSERIQHQGSDMDGISKGHSRRRKSQNGFEKEAVISSRMPGWESGDVREDYKHSITSQDTQDTSRRLSRSDNRKLGADDSASEEEVTDDEEAGLTNVSRAKRRRKERHAALDERVASDVKMSKKERKVADLSVLKKSAINALLIGLW